ncbi:DUF2157 domain-containing protein [Phenylobacterium sp. SCN 70-31]|uniref:DUF2157 domain-containing protein n=1 Tax=Phenylobacterium sp. SCN 70-31 TaxID=1660129 RepID=UPI00086CF451|nr:DUF2157 domain-containing protein [Phenylobacterium sp. SCN 70-31]ODT88503.1 MAG: hypothetical protein ABS78_07790 [Phenylobacterium sp. SCN 70-31]
MADYRERLARDLDRWIAARLVPAENRAAILESVAEPRRLDAATALAIVGGLLAGAAVIAFVAANWSEIPRLARFTLVLAAFLGAAGGAAWASGRGRPVLSQVLLCVAAMVFAAAIGLTGQIFDIAGDAKAALRGAGLAAALLALAGGAPWVGVVALVFTGLGDLSGSGRGDDGQIWPGWLVVAAPLAAATALAGRSSALAHAAGIGAFVAVFTLQGFVAGRTEVVFLSAAAVLGAGAAVARALRPRGQAPAGVLYGWLAWGGLACFGLARFGDGLSGVGHSAAWMALSVAVIVLGRHDRHAPVTAAGVVGLIAAGASLLHDLGVDLMLAAGVFGLGSLVALAVAFALRRRRTS